MKKLIISIIAAGVFASMASAQLVYNVTGSTGVKATFTFTFDDSLNTVTVDVNNNVAGINGAFGTVVGFGFNTPFTDVQLGANGSNVAITSQMIGGNPSTWLASEPWVISGGGNPSPFPQDYGVSTDGSPEGGNPNGGIAYGSSGTFVFTFPDFVGMTGWGGDNSLTVRFQAVTDSTQTTGRSDKVLGSPGDGGGGGTGFVPEPSTYGLFGALALLGLLVARQARRR